MYRFLKELKLQMCENAVLLVLNSLYRHNIFLLRMPKCYFSYFFHSESFIAF